jgi:transposase
MAHPERSVIGGVDCHQQTHHAVLDECGRRLADQAFAATSSGYRQLLSWLEQFGRIQSVGVESTASYGAGLTRYLLGAGIHVIEVNQTHRELRHRRGKTDAIDAEGAARKVLAGEATGLPKDTTGCVEAIRQLHLVRASAVKARTAALEQRGELLTTAPAELRERFAPRTVAQ